MYGYFEYLVNWYAVVLGMGTMNFSFLIMFYYWLEYNFS